MATIQTRITQGGRKRFRAIVRIKGYPSATATFDRKTDARSWSRKIETKIEEGKYFPQSKAKSTSLENLIDRYIDTVMQRKLRSAYTQTAQLVWWKAQLGQHKISDVSPHMIASCRDQLTLRPASVNRYLAALSHVFTVAIREWDLLENNPVVKVSRLKEPKGRTRFLDDAERSHLIKEVQASNSPLLYPIVILALSTGARKGEILNLKWADVDLSRRMFILHDTKNGEKRGLPLVGLAFDLINELRQARSNEVGFVFPNRVGDGPLDIRTAWRTVVKRAELEDFRFHDLRHSAASYLAMNGATLAEIAEVLGHKSLEMVRRYTHLSVDHTASVVGRMNEKIFSDGESS